jgi:hypothetical protein
MSEYVKTLFASTAKKINLNLILALPILARAYLTLARK